ncbi:hypothetical protein, partial [Staphylococcus aureus]|uniref:hypothetical protein n=1 Tax=Staphylococcus aureus TaxID=1280 RepID=UPI0039BECCC7
PGTVAAGAFKSQTGVNLPAHNNDGKGFLEFGGDVVIWRMFTVGPTGNLILAGYNVDGTNRNQPLFVNYTTGQVAFSARPAFDGAMPYDTKNLVNPLTAEGGALAANMERDVRHRCVASARVAVDCREVALAPLRPTDAHVRPDVAWGVDLQGGRPVAVPVGEGATD